MQSIIFTLLRSFGVEQHFARNSIYEQIANKLFEILFDSLKEFAQIY